MSAATTLPEPPATSEALAAEVARLSDALAASEAKVGDLQSRLFNALRECRISSETAKEHFDDLSACIERLEKNDLLEGFGCPDCGRIAEMQYPEERCLNCHPLGEFE